MLAKTPSSKRTIQVGLLLTALLGFVLLIAMSRAMPLGSGNLSNPAAVPQPIPPFWERFQTSGPAFPSMESRQIGVALTWNVVNREIKLFDLASGLTRETFSVGTYPLAVTRSAKNEILVSDAVPVNVEPRPPVAVRDERLLVLDLANLALKRTLPLERRIDYKGYTPSMVLSNSERYLYYLTEGHHIVIIDLDAVADLGTRAYLPAGCGYALLSPIGPDNLIAACPDSGDVQIIDESGTIVQQNLFEPGERGLYADVPAQRKNTVRINFGLLTPKGQIGGLLATGTLMYREADGSLNSVTIIPKGRVAVGQVYQTDAEHVLVAYRNYGDHTLAGFVVFNLSSMQVEWDVTLGADAYSVIPNGPSGALVLKAGGVVGVMDLTSGSARSIQTGIVTENSESTDISVLIP